MTTLREKKVKEEKKIPQENLFFNDSEEIILSEKEIKDLQKKLEDTDINKKTRSFFKSAHQFFKKLEQNNYTISLEEIEKLK